MRLKNKKSLSTLFIVLYIYHSVHRSVKIMTQVVHGKHPHHVSQIHKANVVHAASVSQHATPHHAAKPVAPNPNTKKSPPYTSHSDSSPRSSKLLNSNHSNHSSHSHSSHQKTSVAPVHKSSHSILEPKTKTKTKTTTKSKTRSTNSNSFHQSRATPAVKPFPPTFFPAVAPIVTATPALKSGLFNPSIAPLERYNQAPTYTDTLQPAVNTPLPSTPTVATRLEDAGTKVEQEATSIVQPLMRDGKQFVEGAANTIKKDATVVKEETQRAVKVIEEVLHHNPGYPTENDLPAPYNPCNKK